MYPPSLVNSTIIPYTKCDDPYIYNDELGADDDQVYEKVVEGAWSPYRLVAAGDCNHQPVTSGGDWADNAYEQPVVAPNVNAQMSLATTRVQSDLKYLHKLVKHNQLPI